MRSYIKITLLALCLILTWPAEIGAKDIKSEQPGEVEGQPMAGLDEESMKLVNNILNRYTPWESVTFNGKLRTSMVNLPVTPTVKIYAVKDQLFQLSLSAPFVGEVGRLEVTPETLTVVNKLNKTYVRESMESLLGIYPGLIGDLQNLFLARAVVLGQGEFSLDNMSLMTLMPIEDDQWVMVPEDTESHLKYGYVILPNGRTGAMFGYLEGKPQNVTVTYGYDGGMEMNIEVDTGKGKEIAGSLDFSSVKWGGNRMSSINLDRYRKVSISEFVKNYR